MSTYIDIHIIQNLPPSCVNRDDSGSPKSAVYGGVRRLRVSSQSWKRAARLYFNNLLDADDVGVRTKRVVEVLASTIAKDAPELVENAAALADELTKLGYRIVSGGTDTHVMLVDLTNKDITGKEAQTLLDEVNITANRNTIPFEPRSPFVTSGIRLGSPALTTRGFREEDMREVARIIAHVLDAPTDESRRAEARRRVDALCKKYPIYEHLGEN